MVTAIVEDPKYLNTRFVTSSHFKREPDGRDWNPQAMPRLLMFARAAIVAALAAWRTGSRAATRQSRAARS